MKILYMYIIRTPPVLFFYLSEQSTARFNQNSIYQNLDSPENKLSPSPTSYFKYVNKPESGHWNERDQYNSEELRNSLLVAVVVLMMMHCKLREGVKKKVKKKVFFAPSLDEYR